MDKAVVFATGPFARFHLTQGPRGGSASNGGAGMTVRTHASTVTFKRPFALGGMDEVLPAGDYQIETDEELIEGVSFLAYRRVSVRLYLPSPTGNPALTRTVALAPGVLDAALLKASAESVLPA